MRRATTIGGLLVLLALGAGLGFLVRERSPFVAPAPEAGSAVPSSAAESHPGFLHGRVSTVGGTTYEGRLRFGGREEAFWGDYFNGVKAENPWAASVPPERLTERHPVELFGLRLMERKVPVELGRPFMARLGDIARIEAGARELRVTLKSGTAFVLDRLDADDLADGLRVWDRERGVVDLDEVRILGIEFLPTPPLAGVPPRLHGTVRTAEEEFTGFVQWNRRSCVGTDEIEGRGVEGPVRLRFDSLRSIDRSMADSSLVTLLDGRQVLLSGTPDVGEGNRGVFVDDPRYGRVLVSWEAFERLDLRPGDSGPAYDDFPPGRPLTGSVVTRDGRRLAGRLVYDLDESETTETLDAPAKGVSYTIPFGRIASLTLPAVADGDAALATVRLRGGEELHLERRGDLSDANGGVLVFADAAARPEHVPWPDLARIDLDE